MSIEPLLRVNNVSKTFGSLKAVTKLRFDLYPKEVFGIVGPNGAGKSTLIEILSQNHLKRDSGTVLLNGEETLGMSGREICQRGLVRTFQAEMSFENLSVDENVRLAVVYGRKEKANERELDAITAKALKVVGLGANLISKAGEVSVLDRKKLMIASALACDPCIILLDEPASGLNELERLELIKIIERIRQNGVSVLVIEHVISLLKVVADRMMVMVNGEKFAEGFPSDVLEDPRVLEAYFGVAP